MPGYASPKSKAERDFWAEAMNPNPKRQRFPPDSPSDPKASCSNELQQFPSWQPSPMSPKTDCGTTPTTALTMKRRRLSGKSRSSLTSPVASSPMSCNDWDTYAQPQEPGSQLALWHPPVEVVRTPIPVTPPPSPSLVESVGDRVFDSDNETATTEQVRHSDVAHPQWFEEHDECATQFSSLGMWLHTGMLFDMRMKHG